MGDWQPPGSFGRRLGNVTEWSVAQKCALALGVYLVFDLWGFLAAVNFARHPDHAAYLDQTVLAIEIRLLGLQIVLMASLLAWALGTGVRTSLHPVVTYGTAVLCGVNVLHAAYIYGTHTRVYTAAAICGSVAVATVLFDRRAVRRWLWTVMGALGAITLGEVTGIIKYAPLFARMPMHKERLAWSWLLGSGGISLAVLYVAVFLIYRVMRSWQDRGEQLLETAKEIGVAERSKAIINAIDDGIVVLDGDRRVVSANQAFLRRAGGADITGHPCGRVSPCLEPASECPTRTSLVTGEVQSQIFSRSSDGGGTVWEEVRSSPVFDDSGKIVHVVEVWRDISERRRAEARIAESHRLASLGLLASGFSHELNTPLATVLACVEGILRRAEKAQEGGGDTGWKQIDRNARIAREQLLRCRLTTQHFLRLASGKGAPSELIDVAATVSAVARLSEPTAKARGVAIRVAPPVDGAQVRGNHADLQHILLNLILNAIEVSVPGGEVRLAVDGHDPVRIRVSDDGPGIAPEDQERIFEPFCSLRPGGIGLGLFLAVSFAHRWEADIHVTSAPGAGSTFELVWPAIAAGTAAAGATQVRV